MYYEINISVNGHHLFATAERSIQTEEELARVKRILEQKFPEEEGYMIIITKWEKIGQYIN